MAQIPFQPECRLTGHSIEIRPLSYQDIPELLDWDQFKDPLYLDYNVPFSSIVGGRKWLKDRLEHRWAFAVRNVEGILVGHFSLRNINYPRSSRLGIAFAPPYINQGYGYDTLRTFLDYYFDDAGFNEMKLDVCQANERAIHLYQKLGFQITGSFWQQASPYLNATYSSFIHKNKIRFEEMSLKLSDWFAIQQTLD